MKKYFWKYFLSVFAIALIVLLIQTAVPLYEYGVGQQKWQTSAYNDFVDSVEKAVSDESFTDFSPEALIEKLSILKDERIAGIILMNIGGQVVGSEGKTNDGGALPVFQGGEGQSNDEGRPEDGQRPEGEGGGFGQREDKEPEPIGTPTKVKLATRIDISTASDGSRVITRTDLDAVDFVLPKDMGMQAPFGKVIISLEGEDSYFIDLLTHTPRTYAYSKDIINSFFRGLYFSIPACLIIAVLAAWYFSKRNTKYIDGVRKALNDLAKGKANVSLPKERNSELNEITIAIGELDKDLQANQKSRRAWLHSISHDLNTPTTAMKMIIDGLNDGVFPADESTFKELQKENDTLSERIDRVIEFSSLQADTELEIDTVNTQLFTEEIFANFKDKDSVVTEVQCESIACDSVLMGRAVTELLKNAVEANGGASEPVKWVIKEEGDFYEMDIYNNGHIPSTVDTDIFEPWARGDWSRTSGGSGLGLPIASTIIVLHKGTITICQDGEDKVKATLKWPK